VLHDQRIVGALPGLEGIEHGSIGVPPAFGVGAGNGVRYVAAEGRACCVGEAH
jgi:hypothetical protein